MFSEGQKGVFKIKIRNMTNQSLITEWQNIRCINTKCNPTNISKCPSCDYDSCQEYLFYEEIITNELVDRGLFDYTLNKFSYKANTKISQGMISMSDLNLYYC
ncbi:MAG: hypothetical protein JXA54_14335 [Candidatus Heimdallarchaeota archaeon]|nr:hypothetical protein [Candidatus Heimdallarchaeota archaeon]